jgi:membrane protein YqaA with SNARE-associated domain
MKRLYSWVVNWAHTPYSIAALFILAFLEAIFFPVPADILLIVLVLGYRQKAFTYALFVTLGSVSGAFIGYMLGHFLWVTKGGEFTWFANLFFDNIPGFTMELFNDFKILYDKYDMWIIFTAGFAPIPYKIFTVTAGVFDMNLLMFLIVSLISRGARFFLLTYLLWKYGQPIRRFFEKYFNIIALVFAVLLTGAYLLVKFVF